MGSYMTRCAAGLIALGLAFGGGAAMAQEADTADLQTPWRVYISDDGTECFAVARPATAMNVLNDEVVSARRGGWTCLRKPV